MKKLFTLSVLAMIAVGGFSQKAIQKGQTSTKEKQSAVNNKVDLTGNEILNVKIVNNPKSKFEITEPIVVGQTNYDLQSNQAVPNRLVRKADGTMSVVWTMSPAGGTFTDRGTGYNYFNNTDWSDGSWLEAPAARIEDVKTGWPNNGLTSNGTEFFVVHGNTNNFWKRSTWGTGTWTPTSTGGTTKVTWPRVAVDGDNVYVIGSDAATAGAKMLFYHSPNGGTSWSTTDYQDPAWGNNIYSHIGGDCYAIDAKNGKVAIVLADGFADLRLFTSTNNGTSWTTTIINDFPVDGHDMATVAGIDVDADGVKDSIISTDEFVSVTLDNAGTAHVFFGKMRVLQTEAGSSSYFPYTDGLMYWNETFGAGNFAASPQTGFSSEINLFDNIRSKAQLLTTAPDLNNDGKFNVPDNDNPFGKFFSSITSMPNVFSDGQGGIYVAFSTVMEGDSYTKLTATPNAQNYRQTYVMKSLDNGISWSAPMLVIPAESSSAYESVFACINGDAQTTYVAFQYDSEPGLSVRGDEDPQNVEDPNLILVNKIDAVDFPAYTGSCDITSFVVEGELSPAQFIGNTIHVFKAGDVSAVNATVTLAGGVNFPVDPLNLTNPITNFNTWQGQENRFYRIECHSAVDVAKIQNKKFNIYPNPSTGVFNVAIDKAYTATVTDITGKVVTTKEVSNTNNTIDLSSNGRGVYFVKLQNGSEIMTQRVVVK